MKINVIDGYVVSVQGDPNEEEYLRMKTIMSKRPEDTPGYEWKLNAATLEWEGVTLPPEE